MTRKTDPPHLAYEQMLWRHGVTPVAGLDEAGRGALAGPVAVGAVIMPAGDSQLTRRLACCRDSKQLTPRQRELCAPLIRETALAWAVAFASAGEIDALGIVRATRLAAMRALEGLTIQPHFLLMDFRLDLPECELPQSSVVRGDARCLSIAAASVLAKTTRDALMCEYGNRYQGYSLDQNKGYGTLAHRSALKRLGYSPIHRKSFFLKGLRIT
jgi:ribonuclease HII